jgi:mono/diheme cytochrome c family protein
MKLRIPLLLLVVLLLSACNFSLADDVTPPPGYVSPTPMPDIGLLYPEQPPSPARGEAFYLESCAPCHGEDGLGNGPMAESMPVAVPAIGLRDISSLAAPVEWYEITTRGNLDRGMPPFSGHTSQERWDVLAYTAMLSTNTIELEQGSALYEVNCTECHGMDGSANAEVDFTDLQYMTQATDLSLYRGIAEGRGQMKAYSGILAEDEIWAVAAYLRTLSFDMTKIEPTPTATFETTPTSENTVVNAQESTPGVETTLTDTPSVQSTATITGSVINGTGTTLETGLTATLMLYNSADGQIFDSRVAEVMVDGSFSFTDVYTDLQTAYWVAVDYQGATYYSDFSAFDGTTMIFDLPVTVYDSTADWQTLRFDLVHIAMETSGDTLQVSELYVFSNPGTQTVLLETDGSSLAFIELPEGVTELAGLSPDSRGASFLPAGNGIAVAPMADAQYGVVATFSVPYNRRFEFNQNFSMPIGSLTLFMLDGYKIKTDQLDDSGIQDFNGTAYHLYEASDMQAGVLSFTISGAAGGTGGSGLSNRTWLVFGVAGLGVLFIGLGILLFLRDRAIAKKEELEDERDMDVEPDALGDDRDALADAIIALDEQLKNEEISKDAYEKRRFELKERLKKLL